MTAAPTRLIQLVHKGQLLAQHGHGGAAGKRKDRWQQFVSKRECNRVREEQACLVCVRTAIAVSYRASAVVHRMAQEGLEP